MRAMTPRARNLALRAGWTDERVELLSKLWREGLSCSQIAAQMGNLTRNAVIGKVHRLGLPGCAKPSAPRTTPRAPVIKRTSGLGGGTKVSRAVTHPKPLPTFRAPAMEIVTDAKPWMERKRFQCAFPVSGEGAEVMSCCAPVWETRNYCQAHSQRMFVKPRTEAQREADMIRGAKMRAGKARAA